MIPKWIKYEFYGEATDISDVEKQKLSELHWKIYCELSKLNASKNEDSNFELKKEVFEEEFIKIILDNPNILFTVQHWLKAEFSSVERLATLYDELLNNNFIKAATACLAYDGFRHTMLPYGQYPATRLVFARNGGDLLLKLLDYDSELYTQIDEEGQNIGMYCAGPKGEHLKEVLFKFLDHEEASIAQDNKGRTIGMHCAMWGIKDGVIKASKHEKAKELCDNNGNNIFDYATKNKIEIPELTPEEIKEMYKKKLKKSLR